MTCDMYHSCMVAVHYVYVDAPLDDHVDWMTCDMYHSCMVALHHVYVDAPLAYIHLMLMLTIVLKSLTLARFSSSSWRFHRYAFATVLGSALFVLLTASVSITVHLPAFYFNLIGTSSAISSDSGHISVPPSLIHTVFYWFFTLSFCFPGIKFSQFTPPFAFSSQFSYMCFVFYITFFSTSSAATVQYIHPQSHVWTCGYDFQW
jgi:hypothetical protein